MARKILDFMQDIPFSSNDYFDKEKITTLCVKFDRIFGSTNNNKILTIDTHI
jgi:hypothetical protein